MRTTSNIEYFVAQADNAWGIFRNGVPLGRRADLADAIAYANFFADREALMGRHGVRVSGCAQTHSTLALLRLAA